MSEIKPCAHKGINDIPAASARKTRKTANAQNVTETVRLVYVRNTAEGHIALAEYGGIDVGVGGERYVVRKEGSRSVVDVPPAGAVELIKLGFMPSGAADKQKIEAAAQRALAANEADRKPKARPRPIRERYAALVSFVAFARGEDAELPGIPLRYTRPIMLAGGRLAEPLLGPEVRELIHNVLRQVANTVNSGSKASDGLPPRRDIKLPAPPGDILRMIGTHPVLIRAHHALIDLVEALFQTLDVTDKTGDLSRLKICPICATLFVALNEQSQACSPRCSNTLRQRNFWARAEEKKKAEYREHADHNRVQRRKKKRLSLTGQLQRPR
jgi:hypothetical protein